MGLTRSRSASPSGNPPRTTPMSAAGAHEPSCSRLFVCGQVLPFSNLAERESFLPDSPAPLPLPSANRQRLGDFTLARRERKFSAGLAGTLAAAKCKQAALGRFYFGSLSNRECLARRKEKQWASSSGK